MFNTLKYNSKSRWLSYWYQISEALEISPGNVLVVGKGSGITEHAITLFSQGKARVITLDIDPSVNPDFIGSVTNLPFENNTFDVSVCCQVLEHLPFDQFPVALSELRRVSKRRVILSLPHGRNILKLSYRIRVRREKNIIIKKPFTKKSIRSKEHLWEIARIVTHRQVVEQIKRFFEIEKDFFNEINFDHRFFILKKK